MKLRVVELLLVSSWLPVPLEAAWSGLAAEGKKEVLVGAGGREHGPGHHEWQQRWRRGGDCFERHSDSLDDVISFAHA